MDTVRLGVVGCGFMGLTYSESINRYVERAELVAVAGGSRAGELAAQVEVPALGSVDELLEADDIDAVVLATPDQLRPELTERAAAAGKHVLAEKPMAPTVAGCDRMIAACQDAGVKLAVVKTERYRRITRKAKELIDAGEIGPVWMVRTISSFPRSTTEEISETRQWMYESDSSGLFFGIATHNTDFLRWLTGAEVIRVFAQVHTFSDIPAEAQSVMAQLVFDNGVMGHLWSSSEFPSPGWPASEVRFQVVGRDGMLDLENFDYLDLGKGKEWERVFTPEKFDYLKEPTSPIRLEPHVAVVQEFVDAICEDRAPAVGGAEGRAAVEICEACLVSARTGQAVDLPLGG